MKSLLEVETNQQDENECDIDNIITNYDDTTISEAIADLVKAACNYKIAYE